MTPAELCKRQAADFAAQLDVDPGALYRAAMAAWSSLNPQSVSFDSALSVAGAALRAAVHPRAPISDVVEFAAECSQVRNFPLADLCRKAARGDDEAHRRVTAIMAGEGDPNARPCGACAWCDNVAYLVAVLGSDTDAQVCADCHANPGIPTISLAALADETPVYVIARSDLAEMAWRDVTDEEVRLITGAITDSGIRRAVGDIVNGVLGPHPAFSEED
jgi:hypothetical protein